MAIERLLFSFAGFLEDGQLSSTQTASYRRVVRRVEMSLKGATPAPAAVTVRLRLNGVVQPADYLLGAGLRYADNAASLTVEPNVPLDVVVTANGGAADLDVWVEFTTSFAAFGLDTTDLGLGTLGQLKRFLITASQAGESTYDEAIAFIGRGVSAAFDHWTGRVLRRAVDAVETIPAYRSAHRVRHAPIETITSLEAKYQEKLGWQSLALTEAIDMIDYEEGILTFAPGVKRDFGQLRLTLTGGYWVDMTDDESGAPPAGAKRLPDDIKLAWLLQCQHLWVNRDNLGITFLPSGEVRGNPRQLEKVMLLPVVGATLANYSSPVMAR